jgi:hypothetical protein
MGIIKAKVEKKNNSLFSKKFFSESSEEVALCVLQQSTNKQIKIS